MLIHLLYAMENLLNKLVISVLLVHKDHLSIIQIIGRKLSHSNNNLINHLIGKSFCNDKIRVCEFI